MLTIMADRPEVFKDTAVSDPVYLQGKDGKGVYGYLLLNFNKDTCLIHMHILRWGAGVLKEMKKDWERVKDLCRKRGCTKLFAVNQHENIKWYRFLGLFGFADYTEARVYHQEV